MNIDLERLSGYVPYTECTDVDAIALVRKHGIAHTRRGRTYFIDMTSLRRKIREILAAKKREAAK